ncbi:MAG: hypothetical protein M5U08_18985 [Burkholderiales bacterium]|nr:hypothetical protein [Burkholderiales bacterium]
MEATTIGLRLLHIGSGVFWAGAAMMLVAFVEPTVRRMGPEGGRFMQRLMGDSRLPATMGLAAALTVLSGLALYWSVSGGASADWVRSGHGLAVTLGGAAGVVAFLVGLLVNKPTAARLVALARQLGGGGTPSADSLATVARLQQRLRRGSLHATLLLVVSVAAMASARFLHW